MLFLSYSFRFSNYIIIESGCRRRKRTSMMSESRGMYVCIRTEDEGTEGRKERKREQKYKTPRC